MTNYNAFHNQTTVLSFSNYWNIPGNRVSFLTWNLRNIYSFTEKRWNIWVLPLSRGEQNDTICLHTIPHCMHTNETPHQEGGREEFTLHGFVVWTYSAVPKTCLFPMMPLGIFKMEFLWLNLKLKFTEKHKNPWKIIYFPLR